MKVEIRSMWDDNKHRPNVWLNVEGENDTETALMRSLYAVRPRLVVMTDGKFLIDFYPIGEIRKRSKKR